MTPQQQYDNAIAALARTEAFPIIPKKKKIREDLGDKLVGMLSTALEAESNPVPETMQRRALPAPDK
jgi:hypothetical protein